jgi:hypothetical protein
MATEIKGFKCPGCGRYHKAPTGWGALAFGVDFARDGERDVTVITQGRRIMDAEGNRAIVIERVVRIEDGRVVEVVT